MSVEQPVENLTKLDSGSERLLYILLFHARVSEEPFDALRAPETVRALQAEWLEPQHFGVDLDRALASVPVEQRRLPRTPEDIANLVEAFERQGPGKRQTPATQPWVVIVNALLSDQENAGSAKWLMALLRQKEAQSYVKIKVIGANPEHIRLLKKDFAAIVYHFKLYPINEQEGEFAMSMSSWAQLKLAYDGKVRFPDAYGLGFSMGVLQSRRTILNGGLAEKIEALRGHVSDIRVHKQDEGEEFTRDFPVLVVPRSLEPRIQEVVAEFTHRLLCGGDYSCFKIPLRLLKVLEARLGNLQEIRVSSQSSEASGSADPVRVVDVSQFTAVFGSADPACAEFLKDEIVSRVDATTMARLREQESELTQNLGALYRPLIRFTSVPANIINRVRDGFDQAFSAGSHIQLAEAFYYLGMYSEAQRYFQRALQKGSLHDLDKFRIIKHLAFIFTYRAITEVVGMDALEASALRYFHAIPRQEKLDFIDKAQIRLCCVMIQSMIKQRLGSIQGNEENASCLAILRACDKQLQAIEVKISENSIIKFFNFWADWIACDQKDYEILLTLDENHDGYHPEAFLSSGLADYLCRLAQGLKAEKQEEAALKCQAMIWKQASGYWKMAEDLRGNSQYDDEAGPSDEKMLALDIDEFSAYPPAQNFMRILQNMSSQQIIFRGSAELASRYKDTLARIEHLRDQGQYCLFYQDLAPVHQEWLSAGKQSELERFGGEDSNGQGITAPLMPVAQNRDLLFFFQLSFGDPIVTVEAFRSQAKKLLELNTPSTSQGGYLEALKIHLETLAKLQVVFSIEFLSTVRQHFFVALPRTIFANGKAPNKEEVQAIIDYLAIFFPFLSSRIREGEVIRPLPRLARRSSFAEVLSAAQHTSLQHEMHVSDSALREYESTIEVLKPHTDFRVQVLGMTAEYTSTQIAQDSSNLELELALASDPEMVVAQLKEEYLRHFALLESLLEFSVLPEDDRRNIQHEQHRLSQERSSEPVEMIFSRLKQGKNDLKMLIDLVLQEQREVLEQLKLNNESAVSSLLAGLSSLHNLSAEFRLEEYFIERFNLAKLMKELVTELLKQRIDELGVDAADVGLDLASPEISDLEKILKVEAVLAERLRQQLSMHLATLEDIGYSPRGWKPAVRELLVNPGARLADLHANVEDAIKKIKHGRKIKAQAEKLSQTLSTLNDLEFVDRNQLAAWRTTVDEPHVKLQALKALVQPVQEAYELALKKAELAASLRKLMEELQTFKKDDDVVYCAQIEARMSSFSEEDFASKIRETEAKIKAAEQALELGLQKAKLNGLYIGLHVLDNSYAVPERITLDSIPAVQAEIERVEKLMIETKESQEQAAIARQKKAILMELETVTKELRGSLSPVTPVDDEVNLVGLQEQLVVTKQELLGKKKECLSAEYDNFKGIADNMLFAHGSAVKEKIAKALEKARVLLEEQPKGIYFERDSEALSGYIRLFGETYEALTILRNSQDFLIAVNSSQQEKIIQKHHRALESASFAEGRASIKSFIRQTTRDDVKTLDDLGDMNSESVEVLVVLVQGVVEPSLAAEVFRSRITAFLIEQIVDAPQFLMDLGAANWMTSKLLTLKSPLVRVQKAMQNLIEGKQGWDESVLPDYRGRAQEVVRKLREVLEGKRDSIDDSHAALCQLAGPALEERQKMEKLIELANIIRARGVNPLNAPIAPEAQKPSTPPDTSSEASDLGSRASHPAALASASSVATSTGGKKGKSGKRARTVAIADGDDAPQAASGSGSAPQPSSTSAAMFGASASAGKKRGKQAPAVPPAAPKT